MTVTTWIKRIVLGALSAGTSAVIAACYGVWYGDHEDAMVNGHVTADGAGVSGLEVCAVLEGELEFESSACTHTEQDGGYGVYAAMDIYDQAWAEGFLLTVRDVDGDLNGTFEPLAIPIGAEAIPLTYDVELLDEPLGDDDSSI